MRDTRLFRLKPIFLLLVSIAGLYGLNYLITPSLVGERLELTFRPRFILSFDSDVWKRSGPTTWKPTFGFPYGKRCEMVDSLLATRSLINLETNKVEDLLGKPDTASEQGTEAQFFYVLGDQKDYPAKSIWFPRLFRNLDRWMLEIRFRNGKVYFVEAFFT